MKVYLITDEQIMKLYASGTAGSRNFERVIEAVQRQEIGMRDPETLAFMKEALKAREQKL